jgi:hypothetical protein
VSANASFEPATGDGYYYERRRPWESNAERLVTDALQASQVPADVLRMQQAPLPQIVPFPARYGYPTYSQRQPGVAAVLDSARLYGDNRNQTSGGVASIDGSARNVNMGSFG